jgi:hypothetical protein
MSVIDDRGRVFGRFNIVDAAIAAFVLLLLPLAYGTYLLFTPTRPRIESVAPSEITREERRIGNGAALTAKFKVRGTGFTPLLRARVGGADALGFVFENPNSADILVGPVPAGKHDLILLDGVQEVARAAGAIEIQGTTGTPIRVAGWLVGLDAGTAKTLKAGATLPGDGSAAFQIVEIGPEREGRVRQRFGIAAADRAAPGTVDREAVLTVHCDFPPPYDSCSIGGQVLTSGEPIAITLPGTYRFELREVLPVSDPVAAVASARFTGPGAALIRVGDRDALLDARAARVTAITSRDAGGTTVSLELGIDDSRDGWRYRGLPVRPGGSLSLATDRYETSGQVLSLTIAATARGTNDASR